MALIRAAGNLTKIGRFEQVSELKACNNYALKAVSYRKKFKKRFCCKRNSAMQDVVRIMSSSCICVC
jgi:hypothetical protein